MRYLIVGGLAVAIWSLLTDGFSVQALIAVAIGVLIWRIATRTLEMLATAPPEPDPEDVEPSSEHFRCSVCGTELTVTVKSTTETNAPRHCREEMTLVWRPT